MSATSGMTYALSGSAGSTTSGKPKSEGSPSRDRRPARAGVVGAVDAAVELHEEPLGPRRRAVHVVDAERDRVLARLLRQVSRDMPCCRCATSRRRHRSARRRPRRSRSPAGSGRPATGRSSAGTARRRRAPLGPRRLRPTARWFSSQLSPPSSLRNSAAGAPPAEHARRPRPGSITQIRSSAAPPSSGSRRRTPAPLAREVVGVEQLRPVERRRHAREDPAVRWSRIANSTASPGKRARRHREAAARPAPSTNRPFFVPTSSSVIGSSSGDRGEHMRAVPGPTAVRLVRSPLRRR